MTEIIYKLPTTLQIECLKYLITPNERILLIGIKGVGKKSFINSFTNKTLQYTTIYKDINNTIEFVRLNDRVNLAVLSELWGVSLETQLLQIINQLPTRVILMGSVISAISLKKIYQIYIPLFLALSYSKFGKNGIKIDIILTHTDHPNYTWKQLELRTLKRKIIEFKMNPLCMISTKTGDGLNKRTFEFLSNEF
jgi:hypothetical protein